LKLDARANPQQKQNPSGKKPAAKPTPNPNKGAQKQSFVAGALPQQTPNPNPPQVQQQFPAGQTTNPPVVKNLKQCKYEIIPTNVWNPQNLPIPDYSTQKVRIMQFDNASSNPLCWSHNLLSSNKLCYYCARPLSDTTIHPSQFSCRQKYLNYNPADVKTLLAHGLTPPTRSSQPTDLATI
jgi:hypothetical protein